MLSLARNLANAFAPLRKTLETMLAPLVDLAMRLVVGNIFFKSGQLKLNDMLNGTFDRQVFLFKEEYGLPFPEINATLATGGEVVFSVLLMLGLFTRFSAAALLVMTGLAIYIYPDVFEHYFWALLLLSLLARGGGNLSLDRFIFGQK